MPLFEKITIVGMGLIGGSVGIATKKMKIARRVIGLTRDAKHKAAILKAKAADAVVQDYADAIPGSDLVLLAVPVSAMEHCAKDVLLHAGADTIVTDVGSVKGPVVASLEEIFARKGKFVGSHPMAGSEKSGIEAADGALFEKALCILTPTPKTDPKALAQVQKFWRALGCKCCLSDARDHDRVIAAVSHLPHVLAAVLMHTTNKAGEGFEDPMKFIGPSFRDMTRIAASSPELWVDIVLNNRWAVLQAISGTIEQLEGVREMVEKRNKDGLLAFFRASQSTRSKLT